MNSNNNVPLAAWSRYLKDIIAYGSLKKHMNLIRLIYFWKRGAVKISTKPAFLKVEISNYCTVNCKYCNLYKSKTFYPIDSYRELLDKFKDYIYTVSLYDIGEPLQNKEIHDYIKYAKQRKVGTVISTTLSVKRDDQFWEDLVLSGLDQMIVAIDGISEVVYRKYRRKGDFELVFENLKKIIHFRNIHNKKLLIEWQMIDFPWNREEQEQARIMSKDLGCNRFRLIKEAMQHRLKYKEQNRIRKRNCLLPYLIFIVTSHKKVRPCYKIYEDQTFIGNLNYQTPEEIWNGEDIFKIRDRRIIQEREGCRTCRE